MTIQEWFNKNGSFDDGLEIYARMSRNQGIVRYLTRKRDMGKLRYELGKLRSVTLPSHKTAPVEVSQSAHVQVFPQKLEYDNLPAVLQPVYKGVVEGYRRMRAVYEKMKLVKKKSDRKACRTELIALDRKRRCGWEVIDRWRGEGVLPDPTLPIDSRSVNAARVSITRNLPKLEAAADPRRVEELVERLRRPVAIVLAAGGTFSDKADTLRKFGLI